MAELFGEYFSPWSEKARWALDHHRVPYRYREHVPLIGEPALRLRLRDARGRVSVPVLIEGSTAIRDSLAIAEHAESVGSGAKLFPVDRREEILQWNERSERALAATRVRVAARTRSVPGAKAEALPAPIPDALRPLLSASTGLALSFLQWKYGFAGGGESSRQLVRAALADLRRALDGKPYLHGAFGYGDITMAVVLQGVRPVSDAFIPLGPATREVWSDEELAREFADLLEWREALYARHRST